MQQVDDPPFLSVGTAVSAKYKGAFCEAKVQKVVRNIKCRVSYKQAGLGISNNISDDQIKSGPLRVGATVEVKVTDKKDPVEATITKIQDGSQYTVVFDDGDIATLKRSALCLKSGRHFNESETLDQLPLTHPEHFGNPVIGGRRGRRRHLQEESSDEEDEPIISKEPIGDKEEHIGKVVCVELTDSKKKGTKETWFPGLVVCPTAQETVRIRVKDDYLVRSFKDGRYYTVPKKEATEFTREMGSKQDNAAVSAALEYLDKEKLPNHWDRDALFGLTNSSSDYEQDVESDSSDDEPTEEKDHFVAQLYKFMDDRGTPLNKIPSIINKDVDLYRLFRAVQKLGGYNRVTSQNQWKSIALRLGYTQATQAIINLVKQAYKKYLLSFEDFNRKLGCTMIPQPSSSRSKGRSLVRARSVASPKLQDSATKAAAADKQLNQQQEQQQPPQQQIQKPTTSATNDESENDSNDPKSKRKTSTNSGKVKGLIEKFEEKTKEKEAKDKELKEKEAKEKEKELEKERDEKERKEKEVREKKERNAKEKEKEREKEKEKEREREKEKEKEKDKEKEKEEKEKERTSSITSTNSSNNSNKKEKAKKTVEEKRGRKKKDEPSDKEKSTPSTPTTSGGVTPNFSIEVGDKLKVYYHEQKHTYDAKVLEIAEKGGVVQYLVHYNGWNSRYDEWVKKDRIAENLTKDKPKKKGQTPSSAASKADKNDKNEKEKEKMDKSDDKAPTAISTPSSSQTASTKSKRGGRNRGDTTNSSRSTTPLSNTSTSRTKSPATAGGHRRITRGKPNFRRTSNNTDISSLRTDSDTDSDEPIKKPSTSLQKEPPSTSAPSNSNASLSASANNSSLLSSQKKDDSKIIKSPSSDFSSSDLKTREYDLNQIRSELKGLKELKGPDGTQESSSKSDDEKSTKSSTKKLKPILTDCSSSNSSSSDSCGATASDSDSSNLVPSDVPNSSKSADTSEPENYIPEKLLERSATLILEVGKRLGIKKLEDTDEDSKGSPLGKIAEAPSKSSVEAKQPTLYDKVVGHDHLSMKNVEPIEKQEKDKPSVIVAQSSVTPTTSTKFETTPKKPTIFNQQRGASTTDNKLGRFGQLEKSVAPVPKEISPKQLKDQKGKKTPLNDIYEFKDNEEFGESAPIQVTPKKELSIEVNKSAQKTSMAQNRTGMFKPGLLQLLHQPLDIERMLKTSILQVPSANKKRKKSIAKEETKSPKVTPKKEVADEKTPTHGKPPQSEMGKNTRLESTFDVLRKSPSFNMTLLMKEEMSPPSIAATHANALQAPLAIIPPVVVKDERHRDMTVPVMTLAQNTMVTPLPEKTVVTTTAVFTGAAESTSLLSEIAKSSIPASDSDEDKKTKFENMQEMLVNPTSFDIDTPKKEKPAISIADKLLKAIQMKNEDTEPKTEETLKIPPTVEPQQPPAVTPMPVAIKPPEESELSSQEKDISKEDRLSSLQTALIISTNHPNSKKPILASPEHPRIDMPEKMPKNNDLNETIQRLESVLEKKPVDPYSEDYFSDSTDSEHRLVIEDESQGSEPPTPAVEKPPVPVLYDVKPPMGVLESIMMQSEVPYKVGGPNPGLQAIPPPVIKEEIPEKKVEVKVESDKEQGGSTEPISLLLCEETIPGSPAPASIKDPLGDTAPKRQNFDAPTASSGSSAFVPPQNIMSLSTSSTFKSSNVMTALQHQQQQLTASLSTTTNLKQVDMDIDTEITSNTMPNNSRRMEKFMNMIMAGSTTSSGNNTNNNSDNSPRDSISQDDQSDSEKVVQEEAGATPKKRKRTRKTSESEAHHHKRKRAHVRNPHRTTMHTNDSDSEDNSDPNNAFTLGMHTAPRNQYNFLVQLDPSMSPNQRINLLKKKIQELRKTYSAIKQELACIDRRRKKLRRREREKNAAKVH